MEDETSEDDAAEEAELDGVCFSDSEAEEGEVCVSVLLPPYTLDGPAPSTCEVECDAHAHASEVLRDVVARGGGGDGDGAAEALCALDAAVGTVEVLAPGAALPRGADTCCAVRSIGDVHAAMVWWRVESERRRRAGASLPTGALEGLRAGFRAVLTRLRSSSGTIYGEFLCTVTFYANLAHSLTRSP